VKTEFIDVSDTQKNLVVEIPSTIVDAEIDKVARDYSRAARVPGFRPGKVPPKVVRQRFRDQILHDVAHGLIPRAVDEALRERGVEPVDTPDIRDVVVEEGQPLKFTATFETVPPIEPGDYGSITLHQKSTTVSDAAVDEALTNLRERAARYEPPAEARGIQPGDSVVMDLIRTAIPKSVIEEPLVVIAGEPTPPRPPAEPQTDKHSDVTVEIGATANPPGFDQELIGLHEGREKTFDVRYPDDYSIQELAGTTVNYAVTIKAIRTRIVPELDDEFAKDLGEFESLSALRARVRADLEHEAKHEAERDARGDMLRQLDSAAAPRGIEPLPGWFARRRRECPAAKTVLERLPADPALWESLAGWAEVVVVCGLYVHDIDRAADLAPDTLARLAERRLSLRLEIRGVASE